LHEATSPGVRRTALLAVLIVLVMSQRIHLERMLLLRRRRCHSFSSQPKLSVIPSAFARGCTKPAVSSKSRIRDGIVFVHPTPSANPACALASRRRGEQLF